MGRPRQPTHLHLVKGSYLRNPQRLHKDEPAPGAEVGKPPKRNPPKTWRGCWNEIVSRACPGVLGDSDRVAAEIAARLLAEYRTWGDEMPAARLNVLANLLASFGMTPSDRTKVKAAQPDDEDSAGRYF